MRFTLSAGIPAESVARRATPWILIVAALVAGVTLCAIYGPRLIPFFGAPS